jgi:hypothetical protein
VRIQRYGFSFNKPSKKYSAREAIVPSYLGMRSFDKVSVPGSGCGCSGSGCGSAAVPLVVRRTRAIQPGLILWINIFPE